MTKHADKVTDRLWADAIMHMGPLMRLSKKELAFIVHAVLKASIEEAKPKKRRKQKCNTNQIS